MNLYFIQEHTDEMVAFMDKVAKMLQEWHPDACKVVTDKFSPTRGKFTLILLHVIM